MDWFNNITCPAEADIITAFKARLVVEKSLEYQGNRANTYPQVTETIGSTYHDMIQMKNLVKLVKILVFGMLEYQVH